MKTIWIMVGAPASGKTWFAKNKLMKDTDWAYISRDEIRFSIIKENEDYFSKEYEVFEAFINAILSALRGSVNNVVVDATHLNWKSRRKLLTNLEYHIDLKNFNIVPVVVYSNIGIMKIRNQSRPGRECVPEKAMREMLESMTHPSSDPYGYTMIFEVNNN